ncbi:hypothetical protein RsS62_63810 [Rhizobium dioscoreae]|uniref:hypothetical protein n=1 Tax=Rhizobium TaxID=379 RepID=UPI001260C1A7|nr:hypothetical protein [Rhizobium dioscoreae]GES47129.1 hypothetical protein RsS62_63810 [Rhizobium dioscoreae]
MLKIENCNFTDVETCISLPAEWDGEIEAKATNFLRCGKVVEIRNKASTLPDGLGDEIISVYKNALLQGSSPDQAAQAVSKVEAVKKFLLSNGVDLANLGVATAQLILQITGR